MPLSDRKGRATAESASFLPFGLGPVHRLLTFAKSNAGFALQYG
jgi:hypothetical protein